MRRRGKPLSLRKTWYLSSILSTIRSGMLEARFGVEAGQLVGGALDLVRRQAEALAEIAPAVRDQVLERFLHEPVHQRVGALLVLELQNQALAQVARADAGWIELLNGMQHLLHLGHGERRDVEVELRFGLVFLEQLVRTLADFFDGVLQVAVFADVTEELLGEQLLTRVEVEHPGLVAQIVD